MKEVTLWVVVDLETAQGRQVARNAINYTVCPSPLSFFLSTFPVPLSLPSLRPFTSLRPSLLPFSLQAHNLICHYMSLPPHS